MAGPRFAPRDYAEDVAGFGRVPQLRWVSPRSDAERTFLRAAQLQHQYVLRIRARMDACGMSAKQYAARTGTSYARLMRLLRGEVILRLEDIALADLVLDEVIVHEPAPAPERAALESMRVLLEALPERTAQAVTKQLKASRTAGAAERRMMPGPPGMRRS